MQHHGQSTDHELKSLEAEINAAFSDVTRADGISWNETYAIDYYRTDEECATARLSDRDTHWKQLTDDENWLPFPGVGGFSFIDSKGFRYYLPPTMIRFLRGTEGERFQGEFADDMAQLIDAKDVMWTVRQLRCIAWFISYMARHDTRFPDEEGVFETCREVWRVLYQRGWRKRFEGPHPPYPRTP
ncbi:MAG: DUF6714 family protein [Phycisphaerales bacterium]